MEITRKKYTIFLIKYVYLYMHLYLNVLYFLLSTNFFLFLLKKSALVNLIMSYIFDEKKETQKC